METLSKKHFKKWANLRKHVERQACKPLCDASSTLLGRTQDQTLPSTAAKPGGATGDSLNATALSFKPFGNGRAHRQTCSSPYITAAFAVRRLIAPKSHSKFRIHPHPEERASFSNNGFRTGKAKSRVQTRRRPCIRCRKTAHISKRHAEQCAVLFRLTFLRHLGGLQDVSHPQ